MADTTAIEQEESLWDRTMNAVNSARDMLSGFIGGNAAPAEEAETAPPEATPGVAAAAVEISYSLDENGALIRPDANGDGMENNQRLALSEGIDAGLLSFAVPDFARDGLGYSSGQIDMLDDLARRYDGIEVDDLQGTLVALSENDALRNNVMDALMENDQELAHYAAQAFEQDPSLLAQFEDMVRNDPDAVQDMLPELQDNPASFAEQVRGRGRDAETALAANQEMAEQAQLNTENFLQDFLSGDFKFADILGPQFGGWIDSMMAPFIQFMSGLMGQAGEYLGQNLPEDSPARDLAEAAGIDLVDGTNPDGAEPTGPRAEPDNTNEVDPLNRPATPNPHAP